MTLCEFEGGRCKNCGAPLINRRQICGGYKPGLGDIVAAGLSAVGITKERVSKLVGGDCGCPERQQKLNELGRKYLGIGSPTPSDPLDG